MFRAFPTFLNESRLTLARLRSFALDADPLVQQLVPVARQLSPTLVDLGRLAPELQGFFKGFAPGDRPRPAAPSRRSAASSATTSRRSCARSTRSCASSTRSSTRSAPTSTSSARWSPTRRRRPTGSRWSRARRSTTCGRSACSTRSRSRPIRSGCGSTATSPTRSPAVYSRLAKGLPNFDVRQCTEGTGAQLDPVVGDRPRLHRAHGRRRRRGPGLLRPPQAVRLRRPTRHRRRPPPRELRRAGAVRTLRGHGLEDRLPAHPPRAVAPPDARTRPLAERVRGAARRAAPLVGRGGGAADRRRWRSAVVGRRYHFVRSVAEVEGALDRELAALALAADVAVLVALVLPLRFTLTSKWTRSPRRRRSAARGA